MPMLEQPEGRRPHAPPRILALICLALCSAPLPADEPSPAPDTAPVALGLPDLQGRNRELADFGGKVLLVNFWASWCAPCVAEMAGLQRLADATGGQPFEVIGINVGETKGRARTAAQRLGLRFTVLLDNDSERFRHWGASVLPTTYLIDGQGRVRQVWQGPLDWDGIDVETLLAATLTGEPPPIPDQ